jgi:hypothetical protein
LPSWVTNRRGGGKEGKKRPAYTVNMHFMIAEIVAKGKATYRDILEFYGMGDVYDLYELATVISYNEQPD